MNFKNKKIILGITGSIAAYKAPILVREFLKLGCQVRVVATEAAEKFVSLMVLENLTQNPVVVDMFDERIQGKGAWHIDLAHWCDAMLIAPCSATTLSKLATGNCDNALTCVAIALPKEKHLIVAPAMDFTMYEHPATQKNIETIIKNGAKIIEADEGELASGLIGKGRLSEFETLLNATNEILNGSQNIIFNRSQKFEKIFEGKKILITAGATQEKIDDVRYISNYSTGKMGYALAKVAGLLGAEVTLISGQTEIPKPTVSNFIQITTAEEMFVAVQNNFENQDIIIMSAAVADWTPTQKISGKIKKQDISENYSFQMKKTVDILKWLTVNKREQFIIGFALESENEIENGKKKLAEKNCDMLIINSASKEDSGFGGDNNTISILAKDGELKNYKVMSKEKCAENILLEISKNLFLPMQ